MAFDYGWLVRTGCCARFRPRGHPLENLKLGTGFFYFRGCPGLIGLIYGVVKFIRWAWYH